MMDFDIFDKRERKREGDICNRKLSRPQTRSISEQKSPRWLETGGENPFIFFPVKNNNKISVSPEQWAGDF